jgi:hypothetical protein
MKSVSQETTPLTSPASPAIQILQTQPIQSFALTHYLWERRIPLHVAQRYCVEAQYIIGEKTYYALGIRNDAGGYHLANRYHEYTAGPQTLTFISSRSPDIAIFTHPLSLLTLASLLYYSDQALPDLIIIPDPAFLDSAQTVLSTHRKKHLFPDLNTTGQQISKSLSSLPYCIDHSPLYRAYKTLHHFSCQFGKRQTT